MLAGLLRVSLFVLMAALFAAPSMAADEKPQKPATTSSILNDVAKELKAIDKALDQRVDLAAQRELRERAVVALGVIEERQAAIKEQLEFVEMRLESLGPEAETPEPPEIKGQRTQLNGDKGGLNAAMKRANLLEVDARQLIAEIDRTQIAQFSQKLTTRTGSPFEPAFWTSIAEAFPRDARRMEEFFDAGWQQVLANWPNGVLWPAIMGLVGAILIFWPVRWGALRLGRHLLIEGAPGHRVRRSANALWRVIIGTLTPLLAMLVLGQGFRWAGLMPDRWDPFFGALTTAMVFAGFSASLGGALLMPSAPSWRLVKVGDKAAQRLIIIPWLLSVFAAISITLVAFNREIGASVQASTATEALTALMYLTLTGLCLLIIARLRAAWAASDEASAASSSAWLGAATLLAWLSVATGIGALLLGYVAFSLFVAQLITWATVLASATYLTLIAVDDLSVSVFSKDSMLGRMLTRALGISGSAIDQFGVILSGIARIALVIIALSMLVVPFGAGGGISTLFEQVGALGSGFQIGGVSISFGGILRGIIVLALGLAVVRLLMRWLENTYLPVTGWDDSGRNSFGLITRYLAISLAGVWALASLGIGLENIALLISALSVGIGFGLQAITQNFVSGLILLAERPIKIGDLVRVGDDEGDVKRISVRSTEIVLGDHSTLIVPNSELITKSVLNKTLASPLGLVKVQFSVPISTDPAKVRAIVIAAFDVDTTILDDPKPSVFIDNIADGRIMFVGIAHVASPRATYGARSNVLMALLQRFQDEGIEVGTVPQKLELIQQAPAG